MENGDTKSVICIPFNEEGADGSDNAYLQLLTQEYETLDEVRLRLDAYQRAWHRCMQRLQSSIRSQHEPIIHDVVQHIRNAYSEKPFHVPYDELPVVCIQSMRYIVRDASELRVFQVHLYASDCPNVMAGMKNIITNLTERDDVLEVVKRKTSTSVANFDVEMLVAWYTALCGASKNSKYPLIAIIMHDFEQFDPSVMQDVFYIFSQQVSRLRPVFVLSLSSPVSPSFFHLAYPKSTLSLLCTDTFIAPSGFHVLEKAFQQTFFDIEFDPDILIGPTALVQVFHHVKRNSISLDTFLTGLQLIYLRHFMLNPLSLLVHQTPPIASSNVPLRDIITSRLQPADNQTNGPKSPPKKQARKGKDVSIVVSAIDQAREEFSRRSLHMRLAFSLLKLVYEVVEHQEFEDQMLPPKLELTDMMLDVLNGSVHHYAQRLGHFIRHLDECQLTALLDQLHDLFEHPPLLKDQKKAREEIGNFLALVIDKVKPVVQVARDLCEWLEEYPESLVHRFDDLPLWDIWCTGNAPFPSESLNPSTRATVLSGLLRPHEYTLYPEYTPDDKIPEIWTLPDISILFKRYMESGRMINVYDWYESFQVALERQREHLEGQAEEEREAKGKRSSPKKRGAKAKVQVEQVTDEDSEDDEQWRVQVQARFIRALHELDYLGFIKHTGRKADHVLRTVYDVGD